MTHPVFASDGDKIVVAKHVKLNKFTAMRSKNRMERVFIYFTKWSWDFLPGGTELSTPIT